MSRALTPRGAVTRDRILTAAIGLFREYGPDQASLDDIRAATKTSKSQLFHYFPDGRSGLVVAVAHREAAQVLEDQQPFLGELGTPESFIAWRDAVVAKYRAQGSRCPLTALTRQVTPPQAEAVGPIVATMIEDWRVLIAEGIRRSGRPVDADRHSMVVLAAIQGGVVILQTTGSVEFLSAALDAALEPLIA